jgi:gamma-glutamyltranspeptidase / glutathione hydrolase
VLGTPGGPTIINTVLEVLVNVIDFGMNVQDAVDFSAHSITNGCPTTAMERGFSPDTIALLKARGHR